MIYLDNNATTCIDPVVAEAITRCWRDLAGNPSSQHQFGRRARRCLEESREKIARLLGANTSGMRADRLVFTSGGTESNNLALRGLAGKPTGKVITSAIEHPSVAATAEQLARTGFERIELPTGKDGTVQVAALADLLDNTTRLVSVMLANHETGVIQPIRSVAGTCLAAGVPLHTDAVQAVAKIPVDFHGLGVAAMSVSAHKFHGPVGIGALLVRHDIPLEPILYGGFQQQGLRAGTESVALAVGMSQAIELWHQEGQHRQNHMHDLRVRLETKLQQEVPQLQILGAAAERVPHTICAAFPGIDRQAFVMALDLAGVACSTGSACASGSSEPSPVLQAMGVSMVLIECSVRFSLSVQTTASDIDQSADCITRIYQDLRQAQATRKTPGSPRKVQPNRL